MRDAVIVSTARTPLTKAARGSFNNTLAPTLGAFSVKAAVERAGVEGAGSADVWSGAACNQGWRGSEDPTLKPKPLYPIRIPVSCLKKKPNNNHTTKTQHKHTKPLK